jgi:hypothetical protein
MERKVYEFISTKTNDPIVERKVCTASGTEFPIYQSDLDFYDKVSPVFNGIKYLSYGWTYQACSIGFKTNRIFFSAVITSWASIYIIHILLAPLQIVLAVYDYATNSTVTK